MSWLPPKGEFARMFFPFYFVCKNAPRPKQGRQIQQKDLFLSWRFVYKGNDALKLYTDEIWVSRLIGMLSEVTIFIHL